MEESAKVVQHVTKASSDQLLQKFAQVGGNDDPAKEELRLVKRRKNRRRGREGQKKGESPTNVSSGVVEKRSLLPPANRRSAALLPRLGMGRSQLRVREVRNRSILGAIQKVSLSPSLFET